MIIDTTFNNKYDKIVEAAIDIKEEDFEFFVYSGLQLERRFKEKFTEREIDILKRRCLSGETYKKIAEGYNLSKQRIAQIEAKALRKIRYFLVIKNTHLREKDILNLFPTLDYDTREKIWENNNIVDISIKHYFIECYYSIIESEINKKILQLKLQKRDERGRPNLENFSIEDLEFSVRTYNILKRNGIYNIKELSELLYDGSFAKFRNVGKKSFDEVYKKINNLEDNYNKSEISDYKIKNLEEKLEEFKKGYIVVRNIDEL